MLSGVGDDDALVLGRGIRSLGQIDVCGGFDRDRSRHHEDDKQDQENIGQRGDVDTIENTATGRMRSANCHAPVSLRVRHRSGDHR